MNIIKSIICTLASAICCLGVAVRIDHGNYVLAIIYYIIACFWMMKGRSYLDSKIVGGDYV